MAFLILSVKKYDFTNPDGERINGVKVTYCDEPTYNKDTKGFNPMNITAPIDSWGFFDKVPALYDIDFTLKPDNKGKASLVFKAAKFLKEVTIPVMA